MNISPFSGNFDNHLNPLSSPSENQNSELQSQATDQTIQKQDSVDVSGSPAPIVGNGEPDPPPPSISAEAGEKLVDGSSGLGNIDLLA